MKKIFVLLLILMITTSGYSQSLPAKMSYQAVVRNSSNQLVTNHVVGMKVSILQGSTSGTSVYTETLTPTANANGLISIEIGGEAGFDAIEWANGPYFIKTETDPLGGTAYTITGTSQILTVPYAMYSKTAGNYAETDPVFATHPAKNIISSDIVNWNNKLDSEVDGSTTNEIQTIRISNDTIYLSNGGGFVRLPVGMPPKTMISSASSISEVSATLNGVVNAKGLSTVVVFEWGTTTSYGNTINATPNPVTGNSDINVSAVLDNLISATTYHFRLKAYNAVDVSYSSDMYFVAGFSTPIITTNAVTSKQATTAVSGGSIISDGGSPITAKGICYSMSPEPTLSDNIIDGGTGSDPFISNLTDLTIGTKYYVRAYATNSIGTSYGNEVSFTTVALPTLTTSDFFDIKGTSAKAGGNITSNGGGVITAQGLCWSTSSNPTIDDYVNTSFTSEVVDLTQNTVYYVRAYATNIAGTSYGNEISFNSGYEMCSSNGGGIVFYNDGSGHGLVCAPTNQSSAASWGCYGTLIGTTSLAINTGQTNTSAIIAKCSTAGIAARICDDLVIDVYNDWYLPSLDELNLMYVNLHSQGLGGFASDYYWSSSEDNVGLAWRIHFNLGSKHNDGKDYPVYVRAVRSF